MNSQKVKMTDLFVIPRKWGSIISNTYKFLDSPFRGNDNFLRFNRN